MVSYLLTGSGISHGVVYMSNNAENLAIGMDTYIEVVTRDYLTTQRTYYVTLIGFR